MPQFLSDLAHLASPAGLLALANILVIDVVMSGDNAILIGMAVRKLEGKSRRKAIAFGVVFATVLRVGLAFAATLLLKVVGIQLLGGVLLLFVVWKFYRELRSPSGHGVAHGASGGSASLAAAVGTIVLADVSMSLDNVLAVAGASHGNLAALSVGLVLSILLMAFLSNLVARELDRRPWIQWVGLVVILFVAVEMLLSGADSVQEKWRLPPVLPAVVLAACAAFSFLHAKFVRPADEERVKSWLAERYLAVLASVAALSAAALPFARVLADFLDSHAPVRYFLLFVLLGLLLELMALARVRKNAPSRA